MVASKTISAWIICLAAFVVMTAQASAHDEAFYKNKTVTFIVGSAAGGGYDTYSRLIATHIGRHIPGNPSVVVQNMPGAGSIRAANFLYYAAPKDGTVIGMIDQATYLNEILGVPGLKVHALKFNWIGRILDNSAVLFDSQKSPVKRVEDAMDKKLIVATSGTASQLNWTVLKSVIGLKFELLTGYRGTNDALLAMLRGEVDALSMPWSILKIQGAQLRPGHLAIAYAAGLGGASHCSIVGTSIRTSAVNAALANGMLAHADETDDSHAPSRTHPGCAVIPAALAAAERVGASGERFMRAVVLGYDVAARLNYALDPEGFAAASRSTHSFGGTFGAGAAAGALLRLTEKQIPFLLSYCAQQASGLGANVRDSDHIEKAFDFGGMPARNGMTAATMVAAGFTGVDDVFSGERNFFEAYAANANPDALVEGLGTTFEIMGTNIKKWSVGSPAQSALDAMTHLMETEHLVPNDIETIAVHLPTRSARTVDSAPMPDVNVQHLLAMLLIDRKLTFKSVHDHARMTDDAILALRRRITIVASEELMYARPRRQAIVEVATSNGSTFIRRTHAVRGTADNPMSLGEIEAKARDLMSDVISGDGTDALIGLLRGLPALPDMRKLRNCWEPEATREAAS